MNYELTVTVGAKRHKTFLKDGFFTTAAREKTPLHKHSYAEVHIVSDNKTIFQIGDNIHTAESGNLILIPAGVFHCTMQEEQDSCHIAFQADCESDIFLAQRIHPQIAISFAKEIRKGKEMNDFTAVAAYMSLCISRLTAQQVQVRPVVDYRFLICEFFLLHYNEDLHLSDLAKELHLSERQTARLVLQHTGHTFKDELTAHRVSVAKHLLATTDMTQSEVAQYVGYHSYAGFWKAMKRI